MLMLMFNMLIISFLYMLSIFSMKTNNNKEKLSSFECGFNPITPPRNPFSLQFFKIILIFLLFDLEIILIMPLPFFSLKKLLNNNIILIIMLMILLSLYYEWNEGSLKWMK